MSPLWPRYEDGGLALISSISAYFGAPTGHRTLDWLDRKLAKGRWRNIVMLLYDGMGMAALRDHLPKESFLCSNVAAVLSSTYPSTTTAATTTLESGLSPAEHGWIGWSVFFPELGHAVDLFTNMNSVTGEPEPGGSAARAYMPYLTIFDSISRAGQAKAAAYSAFTDPPCRDLDEIMRKITAGCFEDGRHYFYGYWHDPDHTMHEQGVRAESVRGIMRDLDARTRDFAAGLPDDTLLLVTADHGLVDADNVYIEDHPALQEALECPPSVESRAAALHVKQAYRERFPALFEEAFPGRFLLMNSDAVLASGLLGPGKHHPRLRQSVGDYMAFSLDNACLLWKRREEELVGVHAGLTADEMRVPLIVYGAEKTT